MEFKAIDDKLYVNLGESVFVELSSRDAAMQSVCIFRSNTDEYWYSKMV